MEDANVRVRAAGGPTRCPYCHEDVRRETDEWVACEGCLARHHAACWREGGSLCAGCGETRSLRHEAPGSPALAGPALESAPAGAPVVELDLRGRRAHLEWTSTALALGLEPERPEPFVVRVANGTDGFQRIELRDLPPWVRLEGSAVRETKPGEAARFLLEVVPALVPVASPTHDAAGLTFVFEGVARGSLVVATEGESRTIALEVWREHPRWRRKLTSAVLAVVPMIGAGVALILLARLGQEGAGEANDGTDHLRRWRRRASGEQARWIGLGLLVSFLVWGLVFFLGADRGR